MKIDTMGDIFGGKATGVKYEEPSLNEYTTKKQLPKIEISKTNFFGGKVKGLDKTDIMNKLKPRKQTNYNNVFSKKKLPSMTIPKNSSINKKLPKNFTSPKFSTKLPKKFTTGSLPKSFSGYNSATNKMNVYLPKNKSLYTVPKLRHNNKNIRLGSSGKGFEKMLYGASVGRPERVARSRMKKQKGLPIYGDADKDGVANILDCDPLNKWKQGNNDELDQFLPATTQGTQVTKFEEKTDDTSENNAVGNAEPVLETYDVDEDEDNERENVTPKPYSTSAEDEVLRDRFKTINANVVDEDSEDDEEVKDSEDDEELSAKEKLQAAQLRGAEALASKREAEASKVQQSLDSKTQKRKDLISLRAQSVQLGKLDLARENVKQKRLDQIKKKFGQDKPTDFKSLTGVGKGGPIKQDFTALTGAGTGKGGTQNFKAFTGSAGTGQGITQSVRGASGVGASQSLGNIGTRGGFAQSIRPVGTGQGFTQTLGIQSNLQEQLQTPTYVGQPQAIQTPQVQPQAIQTPQVIAPNSPDIPGQDYIRTPDGRWYSRRSKRYVTYPRGKYNKRPQQVPQYQPQQFQQ